MKKLLIATGAAVIFSSGCMTARFVTTQTWVGNETLFVAYTEWNEQLLSNSFESKILRCVRQEDNALKCEDEKEVNDLLNEGSSTKK